MFKGIVIRPRAGVANPVSSHTDRVPDEGVIICPTDDEDEDARQGAPKRRQILPSAGVVARDMSSSSHIRHRDEDDLDRVMKQSIVSNKRFKGFDEDEEFVTHGKKMDPCHRNAPFRGPRPSESTCNLCCGSDGFRKYHEKFLISRTEALYVILEDYKPLVPYQMIISTVEHCSSILQSSDRIQDELRNYQKSLTQFYASMGKLPVFIEVAEHVISSRKHTRIQVYPIPADLLNDAQSTVIHSLRTLDSGVTSKGVIECHGKSAVASAGIPAQRSYIHVYFALQRGIVQMLPEDRDNRSLSKFGREMMAGVLDTDILFTAKVASPASTERTFETFDWSR